MGKRIQTNNGAFVLFRNLEKGTSLKFANQATNINIRVLWLKYIEWVDPQKILIVCQSQMCVC